MSGFLERLGRAAAHRRWLVVGSWVAIAGAVFGFGHAYGARFVDDFRVPGVESQQALDVLEARFPGVAGSEATVVFHARRGTVLDATAAEGMAATLAQIARQPHVVSVDDPLSSSGRGNVSRDGTIAFATVHYDAQSADLGQEAVTRLEAAARAARQAGLQVEFGGQLIEETLQPDTGSAELIGLGAAILVLLVAFGSAVAMAVPVLTAIFSLGTGLSLITVTARFLDIPKVAPILATMIGLGVGIDYALFVVTRYRQSLAEGMAVVPAVGRANGTAGQAVLFAGSTVVVAILGLWLAGIPFVGLMGLAAAIVVAVSVAAALTLLPALLGLIGQRIDRLRVPRPRPRRSKHAGEVGLWERWGRQVVAHPVRYFAASLTVLLLLAGPVAALHLGQIDAGSSPTSTTQRRAYDLLARGFGPGVNGPLLVVAQLPPGETRAVLARLANDVSSTPDVAAALPPMVSPDRGAAVITVIPRSAPSDPATAGLVRELRADVLPRATAGSGAHVYVGGLTASFIDLSDKVGSRLPLFMGVVVALSFLLLVVMFRSILVPLQAAVMTLLSVAAAYGVVVAMFQWGWGKGLIGLQETVPIVSFVPMMMFAILFGLAMDYAVFLLSRIREEYAAGHDVVGSVVAGISSTARVITSAALVMISVFVAFVLSGDPVVKMLGVGLAVAVLVDATVVRIVMVPATMRLLGRWNWWLPGWLDRVLPELKVEPRPLATRLAVPGSEGARSGADRDDV